LNYLNPNGMRAKSAILVLVLITLGTVAISGAATAQAQTGPDECSFPYQTTGLYGDTVLDEEPEAVVTGAPSVTQTVWEMGAQDKVVGVSDVAFVQYLDGVNNYTDVGTAFDGAQFAEQVATANDGQEPDLLIGALNVPGLQNNLEPFGFEYHWFGSSGSFEDIQNTTREIGRLIGECEASDEVADEMEQDIEFVRQAVAGRERPSVLYDLPTEGAFVPPNGTFTHDIITTAGGKNLYAEEGLQGPTFVQLDDETAVQVVSRDPDWIVLPGGSADDVPETDLYNSTTAVQEDQILVLNPNLIQQGGPRVTEPLERMARAFHPEAFESDDGISGGAGQGLPRSMRDGEEGTDAAEAISGARTVFENRTSFEFSTGPIDTVEFSSVVEGEVTVTSLNVGDAPGAPINRFRVGVPRAARSSPATLRATVTSSEIDSVGASAEDIVVATQEGDGWNALETTALETDDGATLVAEVSRFSDFAVVASTSPTPSVEVTEGSGEDTLTLDATGSTDEYGGILSYEWTADGEGYEGETVEVPVPDSEAEATLTVTNDAGLESNTTVTYGNDTDVSEETDTGEETEGDTPEADGDGSTPDEDEGAPESTPGFTALAALISLVALVFLTRRRL